ncbi:hypothetical protein RJT34_30408 [Clitoria ternatea]|uniref:Uncharacterized protein n=1 Tax=Clitoria ternatea TaxID=43366 RepID=A0AAN9ESQ1_CLITE
MAITVEDSLERMELIPKDLLELADMIVEDLLDLIDSIVEDSLNGFEGMVGVGSNKIIEDDEVEYEELKDPITKAPKAILEKNIKNFATNFDLNKLPIDDDEVLQPFASYFPSQMHGNADRPPCRYQNHPKNGKRLKRSGNISHARTILGLNGNGLETLGPCFPGVFDL